MPIDLVLVVDPLDRLRLHPGLLELHARSCRRPSSPCCSRCPCSPARRRRRTRRGRPTGCSWMSIASSTFGADAEQLSLVAVDDEVALTELARPSRPGGSCRSDSAIAGVKPRLMKPLPCTRKSARTLSSMICANDCFADAPMIDTSVTSARPIISADAVVAVRRGLRIAFSRASTPDMPRRRAGTQPRKLRRPGAPPSGLSIATPMNTRNAATPTTPAAPPGTSSELTSPKRPSAARTMPMTASRPPIRYRRAPLVAIDRAVAHRGDRRHARGAARRRQRRHERDDGAGDQRDDDRPGEDHRRFGSGSSKPNAASRPCSPMATSTPSAEPEHRRQQPDDERLRRDRPRDLLARRAERAQQRELP